MAKDGENKYAGLIIGQTLNNKSYAHAKSMRHDMTTAERVLWNYLRGSKVNGLHFRRQQVIGRYIVDFYCAEKRLVIEVDGESHAFQQDYDNEREKFLLGMDISVIRFTNAEVEFSLHAVQEEIWRVCNER